MFNRKPILIILAFLVIGATFFAPSISHAWEKVIEFEVFGEVIEVTLSCYATFCFPPSPWPSGVINEEGCLEISWCGGVFYCSATICPGDDDDDDDTSGNNDDTGGNS